MEKVKLDQCYKCFKYLHKSPQCNKTETLCSRCGEVHDYSYKECTHPFNCINCGRAHSSTAKICPHYLLAQEAHEKIILKELIEKYPDLTNSLATPQISQSPIDEISSDTLRAARLASTSPQEFLEQLFSATSSLIKPISTAVPPPNLWYRLRVCLRHWRASPSYSWRACSPQNTIWF